MASVRTDKGHRRRRFIAWLLVALAVIFGGTAIYEAYAYAQRTLPAYLAGRIRQALGREVTLGRISPWPPGAFSIHGVRIVREAGEDAAPLTADRIRVYLSWTDLLFHRRLRIRELHADGAYLRGRLDLRADEKDEPDPTTHILALGRLGLRRVGLHRSQADLTTLLQNGERTTLQVRGADLVADLRPRDFRYRLEAKTWGAAGLTASDLRLQGRADGRTVSIERSRVRFQGGTLAANGTFVTREGDVRMLVHVRSLPVETLAPQLGLPGGWNVRGQLTGTMEVNAASGALRRLTGTLSVAPGSLARSRAVFPWTNATAQVDWRPDRVTLNGIDVQGNGIRLTGNANAAGRPDTPFVQWPFKALGRVEASRTESVASLAQLLAFSTPVSGRWGIEWAAVEFWATGTVRNLAAARADGRFQARGLVLHPREQAAALLVKTIEGDVERSPDHLHLRRVRAAAEGLTANANLTVTPTRAGREGTFETDGRIALTNLQVFRQQVPDLPVWQWLQPATAASSGRITFAATGSSLRPERARGTGSLRLREFAASVPVGRGTERWTVPMRELRAQLRLNGNRLSATDVRLRSDLFAGSGVVTISNLTGDQRLGGRMRLVSDRWRELPPVRGRIPPGLTGGRLAVAVQVPEGSGRRAPLIGSLELRGAAYQATFAGRQRRTPLTAVTADFRYLDGRVVVPDYRLLTPHFRTRGSGGARAVAGGNWRLRGSGRLVSADAGELARWWTGSGYLDGGRLSARYELAAPSERPEQVAVSGRLQLLDAQPRLPAGTLPFSASEAHINSLTSGFAYQAGRFSFSGAVWRAPRFSAAGSGSLANNVVDGSFRLSTADWKRIAGDLARSLPVEGGRLTVTARVHGRADRLRNVPVAGTVILRGARLASDRNASVPVQGGRLDLRADTQGTLSRIARSDFQGAFTLADLTLPPLRPGTTPARIRHARGDFRRRGTTVSVSNFIAQASGARLTGSGVLRNVGTGRAAHALELAARGPDLSRLLPSLLPLPGTARGGRFNGTLVIRGTAAQRLAFLEGRAEVRGAEWTPPKQALAIPITRLSAHILRRGGRAVIDDAEFRTPGGAASLTGTLAGLDRPGTARHNLRLTWRLEDASSWASRFLPIPGWFTGGVFTGEARITGTPRQPNAGAHGRFEVRNAGFLPPQRFLGGPERPIHVRWARGLFRRTAGRTVLRKLDLNTSVGTATGRVVSNDWGIADVRARGVISRLEDLVDLWPSFDGRLRGGRGSLAVAVRGPLRRPKRMTGTIDIKGGGGVLTVENVEELYASHPFDTFNTHLVLPGDGSVRLENVKLRGPKANLDGRGVITASGRVEGKGNAWLTSEFTKKLVKPRFLYPIAKLVGWGRVKSSFEVHGTLREARLDMGITDSMLWKLAIKQRVPEPLRRIATGKAPLWSGDPTGEADRIARR